MRRPQPCAAFRTDPLPNGSVLLARDGNRQEIGASDEVGHETIDGLPVNLHCAAHLLDAALVHDHDLVRKHHCLVLVVGDVHAGDPQLLLDAPDLAAHLNTQLGVQIAQRFVKEQHFGMHDQGARQRNTLLLSTAQLVGRSVLQPAQLGEFHHFGNLSPNLLGTEPLDLESVGDILEDGEMREDGVALEDHRHIALIRAATH